MNSNNILFLSTEFPPQPGGIGNHAHQLALALDKEGKKITVLADRRSFDGKPEKEFDTLLPFKVQRINRKKFIFLSYFDRFLKALKFIKNVDTVIASGKFSLWMVYFLKLFYHKKYIAIIHGSELMLSNRLLKNFTNNSLKKFDKIIAVSNYTKSLLNNLQLKNIEVIPNGFTILEKQAVNSIFKNQKKLNLITVGNVTQRKGQHNVVRSLPLLLERHPELHYHIVGIPTEKEKLIKLAKELGIENHITFHGMVSENEKWKLLTTSCIFIMLSEATSEGDVEGFGIAILEANALGIPAIGSKGCGIEDAINDGLSGVLVDAQHPIETFDAFTKINNNYEEFSNNAIQWSENFSWDRIVKQYLEVIEK